ncbi:MAG: glycine dehydrogenase (aminomethyl-transferring) [Zetaproteobacteria bacterium CG_4_9_14_3_um_filter_49_83]|nr:MAG: glycine dehydrogenase (aminomethyl-transferring) [Zetaproteobacteria bacterium CG1_02_49_23]PIQ33799.1 MAG: glycine dehydrogenase (aminomethyl-transferring) [Zetaproteobacteria bacterium CG17_big_fil_post_rev_8_21_14_2_50_50_13]PIV31625.1 MAG: glycine dehydrogenase (aminomethyl-transferring) [Zetaproteobacteria bacterium CG02_land_8_20_14_3_00_50_9]PIY55747.1 MAG: glycine dehydrogenase (aminomethyl-transferring) [Zetaproteobacteria bacterium CG_4_10_14_0_8_um_filter_49_80]PJA35068.1 MAG
MSQSSASQKYSAVSGIQHEEALLFEHAHEAAESINLPGVNRDVPASLQSFARQTPANIPGLSEPETVRHFVRLSQWNHGIETGFYPLGSCTMKYNPRVNEQVVRLPGLAHIHPDQPEDSVQGALALLHELQQWLGEISGLPHVTLQPAAGAHGELVGLMIIRACLDARGDTHRKKVLVPDSAHGTNPASAALCGMHTVELKSGPDGRIDLEALKQHLDGDTAALMMTNPNTAGAFESDVREICDLVHAAGGLVYGDGANLNALVGVARPGDMGIDCLHINVHKTFSTPHGGGGPGAGPVAVNDTLAPFLPVPRIIKNGDIYQLQHSHDASIGPVLGTPGQIGVLLRANAYIAAFGRNHLHKIAEDAVLNANYVLHRLKGAYDVPFEGHCKHECLLTDTIQNRHGVKTLDIAKRLIDLGFHPMTVYFPLIVHGAMLIEPTETESRETLDAFCDAMLEIAAQCEAGDTQALHDAPVRPIRRRLDETQAARNPVLVWAD